ncbi:hypothetical protein D3C73_1039260 [compost metagenome]
MSGKNDVNGVNKSRYRGRNFMRGKPACHLHWEGDKQNHIADHRRVKRVLPEAAIQLLGNDHGKYGTQDHHPPGGQRRKADGKQ